MHAVAVRTQGEVDKVSATLRLTHKAIGAEVRRDPYEVVLDDQQVDRST